MPGTWDSDLYTRLAHGGLKKRNGRLGCVGVDPYPPGKPLVEDDEKAGEVDRVRTVRLASTPQRHEESLSRNLLFDLFDINGNFILQNTLSLLFEKFRSLFHKE